MDRLHITGKIIEVPKIIDSGICLGLTEINKGKFKIRLSKETCDDGAVFVDTLLHEFIHLWFFIVEGGYNIKVSVKKQHKFINKFMPVLLKEYSKIIKKGK